MSTFLYSLEGWTTLPTVNNIVRRFDNDVGNWVSNLVAPPFQGGVVSTSTLRQQGGWDGNRWYVISPSGTLYAYTPFTASWSSTLVSGSVLFSSPEDRRWTMCSDGRYLYILSDGFDFRRYDSTNDSITALQANPGAAYGGSIFLVHDLSGSIYGYKGDSSAQIYKYSIGNDSWTALATQATMVSDGLGTNAFAAYLQGKLWVLYRVSNTNLKAFSYNPNTNTWTAGAASGVTFNGTEAFPYGEENDHTIRLWGTTGGGSYSYNINSAVFASVFPLPWTPVQGTNWTVARQYQAAFVWYESDGTTLLAATKAFGTLSVGQTITVQVKVKTLVGRAAGITISVVPNAQTDAEDPVTICNTSNGTYATSFTTGALSANDFTSVFVKITPTISQTLGLSKILDLEVVGN